MTGIGIFNIPNGSENQFIAVHTLAVIIKPSGPLHWYWGNHVKTSQCPWNEPEEYGYIDQIHKELTMKLQQSEAMLNKLNYIFHGIYILYLGCVLEGHFHTQMPSYQYSSSHHKDKTVSRPSHFYDRNSRNMEIWSWYGNKSHVLSISPVVWCRGYSAVMMLHGYEWSHHRSHGHSTPGHNAGHAPATHDNALVSYSTKNGSFY